MLAGRLNHPVCGTWIGWPWQTHPVPRGLRGLRRSSRLWHAHRPQERLSLAVPLGSGLSTPIPDSTPDPMSRDREEHVFSGFLSVLPAVLMVTRERLETPQGENAFRVCLRFDIGIEGAMNWRVSAGSPSPSACLLVAGAGGPLSPHLCLHLRPSLLFLQHTFRFHRCPMPSRPVSASTSVLQNLPWSLRPSSRKVFRP